MSPTLMPAASPSRSPARAQRDEDLEPVIGNGEQLSDLLRSRDGHRGIGSAGAGEPDAVGRIGADDLVETRSLTRRTTEGRSAWRTAGGGVEERIDAVEAAAYWAGLQVVAAWVRVRWWPCIRPGSLRE